MFKNKLGDSFPVICQTRLSGPSLQLKTANNAGGKSGIEKVSRKLGKAAERISIIGSKPEKRQRDPEEAGNIMELSHYHYPSWAGGQRGAPQPWALWRGRYECTGRNRELPTAFSGSGCWCPALVRISRKGQGTSICFLKGNGPDSHTSSLGTTRKQGGI